MPGSGGPIKQISDPRPPPTRRRTECSDLDASLVIGIELMPAQIGGDARVAIAEAASRTVTGLQADGVRDRQLGAAVPLRRPRG